MYKERLAGTGEEAHPAGFIPSYVYVLWKWLHNQRSGSTPHPVPNRRNHHLVGALTYRWEQIDLSLRFRDKRKSMSGARIELAIFGLLPLRGIHIVGDMRPTLYQLSQPDLYMDKELAGGIITDYLPILPFRYPKS